MGVFTILAVNLVNRSLCYLVVRIHFGALGPNQWRIISNVHYVEIRHSFSLKLKKKNNFFLSNFKSLSFSLPPRPKTDHPVHPPESLEDPWDIPAAPDLHHVFQFHEGVYHVFENEEARLVGRALNFPYPDLAEFVSNMHRLCAMIADGPL